MGHDGATGAVLFVLARQMRMPQAFFLLAASWSCYKETDIAQWPEGARCAGPVGSMRGATMVAAEEAAENRLGGVLSLAASYFLTGKLGLLLAIPPGYATAVWPPSGIALAVLLVYGERYWPGVLLGAFLVNTSIAFDASSLFTISKSLAIGMLIASGSTVQALLGVSCIRRWVGYPTALDRERDVGLFLLLGGPLSCLVSASCGIAVLMLTGEIPRGEYAFSWLTWWVGDVIGVITIAPVVMVWIAEPREHWRRRKLSMMVPMGLTFALAVVFFVQVSAWERVRIRQEFVQYAEPVRDAVGNSLSMESALEALQEGRDLFSADSGFGRLEFHRFASRVLERHPEMAALGWLSVVSRSERTNYEARLAAEGFGRVGISERDRQGRLVPAAARAEYVAATFIEPTPQHANAIGYDLASEPVRRAAMQKACDSGAAVMTAPVRLVQDERLDPAELIFLPVYTAGLPHETVAQRCAHLQGYVTAAFHLSSLLTKVARQVGTAGLNVQLFDDSVPGGWQIFSSPGTVQADGSSGQTMEWVERMNIVGRSWRLVMSPSAEYLHAHRGWQGWSVLTAGLLFTSLLGALLLVITGSATRVRMLVERRTAGRNACHLQSLIDDLLDLTRMEAGKAALRHEPVACAEVLEEVAATLRPQAEKKGLAFELVLPNEGIVLETDRRAFAQIIITLVGNAVKYTEQGLVRVELARSRQEAGGDRVAVHVSDTGCGIAEEDLPKLFQSFTLLDATSTRLHEGSSLGLHLSQRLAALIGGRLECRSEPGRGSTFTLTLSES